MSVIKLDKKAFRDFTETLEKISGIIRAEKDRALSPYYECEREYRTMEAELSERLANARRAYADAEREADTAEREYRQIREQNREESTQDSGAGNEAVYERKMSEAREKAEAAERKYYEISRLRDELDRIWQDRGTVLAGKIRSAEDAESVFLVTRNKAGQAIEQIIADVEEAEAILHGGNTAPGIETAPGSYSGTGSPDGGTDTGAENKTAETGGITVAEIESAPVTVSEGAVTPTGWCKNAGLSAVSFSPETGKTISLTIGGKECHYECSVSGIAKAYREAAASGDTDMTDRVSAMFEVQCFRNDLRLTSGSPDIVQLGGYHRDVERQDPKGYQSHHIPSQAVQEFDRDDLPAITLTAEDHRKTSSFAGKQGKTYHSVFPSGIPEYSYKQQGKNELAKGPSGYIHLMKNEVYDLIEDVGHSYDGGLNAYFDAVLDMIAVSGVPGPAKGSK